MANAPTVTLLSGTHVSRTRQRCSLAEEDATVAKIQRVDAAAAAVLRIKEFLTMVNLFCSAAASLPPANPSK